MKKCPHCAEEIQDEATICRFCNRSVVSRRPGRRKLVTLFAIIAGLVFLVTLGLRLGSSVDATVAAFKSASPSPIVANDPVSIVKNGVLDIDRSITIGSAFDHYKYFPAHWKTFQTENGRTVVQVEGSIELEKLDPADIAKPLQKLEADMNQAAGITAPGSSAYSASQVQTMLTSIRRHITSLHIVVEFVLTQDGGFTYRTANVQAVKPDGTVTPELINKEEDAVKLLNAIYENEPPPTILSVVIAGSMAR